MKVDPQRFRISQFEWINDDSLELTEVKHRGQFCRASLDLSNLTEMRINFEEFFPAVSHVFLRFLFAENRGPHLENQFGETFQISDLVLSIEGAPPVGEGYRLTPAARGKYLLSYRWISGEQAYQEMVVQNRHSIRQFRFHLPNDEVRFVFERGLALARERSLRVPYRLFSQNCATSIFELFEGGPRPPLSQSLAARWWAPWLSRLPVENIGGTLAALHEWGVLSRGDSLPPLHEEWRGLYEIKSDSEEPSNPRRNLRGRARVPWG